MAPPTVIDRSRRSRPASLRFLATREGTPGIEIDMDLAADAVRPTRLALSAIHGRVDADAMERAARLTIAVVPDPALRLPGAEPPGRLKLRAWAKNDLVRVELSGPLPDLSHRCTIELVERDADRWGLIGGPERTLWFEMQMSPDSAT